jgi:hypothetical protein
MGDDMQLVDRRDKTAATPDEVWTVNQWCAGTLGLQGVDLARLSGRDGLRAINLLDKLILQGPRDGFSWEQLDARERKQLERLLARAMGLSSNAFEEERKEAEAMRYFATLRAESKRRRAMVAEEQGDFFRQAHACLASGHWWGIHALIFMVVAAQLAAGEPLGLDIRVEGEGDDAVVVFPRARGPASLRGSPHTGLEEWSWALPWLIENEWLREEIIGRPGPEMRLGLGRRGLAALGGPTRRTSGSLRERLRAKAETNGAA